MKIEKLKRPVKIGGTTFREKINELVDEINTIKDFIDVHSYAIHKLKEQQDNRMIGCTTLEIPPSYKSTNDVWRAKLKIATENLQKIRKMGMENSSTAFAMGCVADLALRELDKFDKGQQ